jgi:hypothetical protein
MRQLRPVHCLRRMQIVVRNLTVNKKALRVSEVHSISMLFEVAKAPVGLE